MNSLQFWKSWARIYQYIGIVIGGAFLLALLFFWYAWYESPNPALSWFSVQEQELSQIPVHTFQQGLLELTIQGDNYLIFERFLGEQLKPNLLAGYIFLSMLAVGMVVLISIITTLSRFWYLLGMGLFILFIVGFRMEIIAMFGQANKIFTILVLIVYTIPSFYFHFFRTSVSFIWRLLLFTIITGIVGLVIFFFAAVDYPLLHLSVTGITAGIIISVVFILMVAHEILASFILISSSSVKQRKSLNHFLIISSIYMINLSLAYAHKIGSIDWNFLYINFYLLISISGILGVWGFRQRQPQYEKIMEADPFGVYFFLSLGAICFGTIGYFIGTSNDAALVTINDIIIYSHLGYGIIFLTYVISNFISMLAKNMPVHKVLYKPTNMPYFTFRFGGIIATLAFVFYNTWQTPVQHAFGGYHNAAGDLYQTLGDPLLAGAFYERAGTYGYLNHHSNYALANLEAKKNYNTYKERNYYDRATQRRPTEFAFINLAQTYIRNNQWLEARLTLNEGLKNFPNSGPIKNTLGVVFSKINLPDSSLSYLQEARGHSLTKRSAETNFIGVAAKNKLSVNADSLFTLIASDNKGTQSNALAFANIQGTKINLEVNLEADSVLNLFSASLINNYILNHLGELDSVTISNVITNAKKPVNKFYREELLFTVAIALYADGQVGRAFSLLEEVTILSNTQNKYNTILAMWALENRAPMDAMSFIDYVISEQYPEVLPVAAIALTEGGRLDEALIKWDSLRASPDSSYFDYARQMINALSAQATNIQSLNNVEKYFYSNHRISLANKTAFNDVLASIDDDELKARSILARSQKLFEVDELDEAIATFQQIEGLLLIDRDLYNQINLFELELLAANQDLPGLSNRLKQNELTLTKNLKSYRVYFDVILNPNQLNGDNLLQQYQWLAKANPYHEEAIISAAKYLGNNLADNFITYRILTEALHANPYSVKLLKAYSIEAAKLGFDEYANSALERLRPLMPPQSLRKFLINNQNTFAQVIQ